MSDVDTRIRQAVVEIVEAAPTPPAFEELPTPASVEPRSRWTRSGSFVLVACAVLVTAVGVGTWRATQPDDVDTVRTSRRPPHAVLPLPPAVVAGTEQHIARIGLPDDFAEVLTRRFSRAVDGSTPSAF